MPQLDVICSDSAHLLPGLPDHTFDTYLDLWRQRLVEAVLREKVSQEVQTVSSLEGRGGRSNHFSISKIDPFCCRLLQHRFPSVPNFGDEEVGNSMAVPCMRWIGDAIAAVEALS